MKHSKFLFDQLNSQIKSQQQELSYIQAAINLEIITITNHQQRSQQNLINNFNKLKQQFKFFSHELKTQWTNICEEFIDISTKICIVFIQQMMKLEQEKGEWRSRCLILEDQNYQLTNALNTLKQSKTDSDEISKNGSINYHITPFNQITPLIDNHPGESSVSSNQQNYDYLISDKITQMYEEQDSECGKSKSVKENKINDKLTKNDKNIEVKDIKMDKGNVEPFRAMANVDINIPLKKTIIKKHQSQNISDYFQRLISRKDREKYEWLPKKCLQSSNSSLQNSRASSSIKLKISSKPKTSNFKV